MVRHDDEIMQLKLTSRNIGSQKHGIALDCRKRRGMLAFVVMKNCSELFSDKHFFKDGTSRGCRKIRNGTGKTYLRGFRAWVRKGRSVFP